MPTYDKNIHYLKESLFSKLNGDNTLITLLGGSGRIFHLEPPKTPIYPCVVYNIVNDIDGVYNETIIDGQVTRAVIRIMIFSDKSTTQESDNIEARIKYLLNGQRTLDNEKLICYSCIRESLIQPYKDSEVPIWITPIRYRVTWATK